MSGGVSVVGGPQGPKALLDNVRLAVVAGDLDTLQRLSHDFLAIDDNVAKCIDENGNSITHLAVGKDTRTLHYVINELRADVNATNFQGRTPLHEAVTGNHVGCCEVLLASGANDTVQSATLSTPFHTAAACGSVQCMEVLLRHSDDPAAKVNELDKSKSSALHKCAFDGDVRVSRWLVEHGAVVDACDSDGVTPLLVAVKMGQHAVTQYLLEQGANPNKKDRQGNTCVHFCAIRCDTTILQMLLKAGVNLCVQNEDYNNPLHVAAMHPRPDSKEWEDLIALLVHHGCSLTQDNASHKIPTDYVGRNLKRLFGKDEVSRRRAAEFKARRKMEDQLELAIAKLTAWRVEVQANEEQRREAMRLEDERLAKEVDEQIHVEADARTALEEMVETLRFNVEEIQRKKASLQKIGDKI